MTKLITGGTGYIGSELAHIFVDRGEQVVLFDIAENAFRIDDIKKKVKVVLGDVASFSEVLNVVKENKISQIYHLGSVLTYMSEVNPWASFHTNVIGTYNVLEAARLYGVEQMMFASTIGTFGLNIDEVFTDITIQRPINMYGCGKLYGECLGRYYRERFGIDFRSVRYTPIVGPGVRTPGHWAPVLIEDAILGKPHICCGTPESTISLTYVRDAARAADMLLQAPEERIKMVNYNVAGVQAVVTAKQIEALLMKRFPQTDITYTLDLTLQVARVHNILKIFDDSNAREEWSWQPEYDTPEKVIDIFEKDIREYPSRYGLK
jgi:nucleoside-diphosphate-sugar epimerase